MSDKEVLDWDEIVAMVAAGEITIQQAGERFENVLHDTEEDLLVSLGHTYYLDCSRFDSDEADWEHGDDVSPETIDSWLRRYPWGDAEVDLDGKVRLKIFQRQVDSDGDEVDEHVVYRSEWMLCDILNHSKAIKIASRYKDGCCGKNPGDHEWGDQRVIYRQGTACKTKTCCESCGLIVYRLERGYQDNGDGDRVRYDWDKDFVLEEA